MKNIIILSFLIFYSLSSNRLTAQWIHLDENFEGKHITAIKVIGNSIFVATSSNQESIAVYKSDDYGLTWNILNVGLDSATIGRFEAIGSIIYFSSGGHGIFRSFDLGFSWTNIFSPQSGEHQYGFVTKDSVIIIVSNFGDVFQSLNLGDSWAKVDSISFCNWIGYPVSNADHIFFPACDFIFSSTDNGSHWTPVPLDVSYDYFFRLFTLDTFLFAADIFRIYGSSDQGNHWVDITGNLNGNSYKGPFGVSHNNLLVATQYGVFVSTANGQHWHHANEGLLYHQVKEFASLENFVFAATDNGIYRIDTSEILNLACDIIRMYANVGNASCLTCPDGAASVMPYIGTPPFTYTWNTNPVQTTQTVTGLLPGTYTCCVTDANGCSNCNEMKIGVIPLVDVDQFSNKISFEVFPNPATDFVIISSDQKISGLIKIYDAMGHMIFTITIDQAEMRVSLADLPSGLYILEVSTNKGKEGSGFWKIVKI